MTKIMNGWSPSNPEVAIQEFLRAFDSQSTSGTPISFCVFAMTEQQFVALTQTQQQAEQQSLLSLSQRLRQFAVQVKEHADALAGAGDGPASRNALLAIRQLGQDNAQAELTQLAKMTGEAIRRLADQELANSKSSK